MKMMKKRYNIMLNPAIVQRIDKWCELSGDSRSELINRLLYEFIIVNDLKDIVVPELEGQVDFSEVVF